MTIPTRKGRFTAFAVKLAALAVGLATSIYAVGYLYDELTYLAGRGQTGLGDIVVILTTLAVAFSGVALAASLPDSLRLRFRRPRTITRVKPVYGFGTVLAVGLGATLGSPLFILIPQNVVQYESVSLVSLVLAAVLSVGMARVYSRMYTDTTSRGLGGLGGPSFTKVAVGARSFRYFISRISMWVANTALAAYSKIVFITFDFVFLPKILGPLGVAPPGVTFVVYLVAGTLIAWTVLDAFFERRLLRLTGVLQVVLTILMVAILVYQSALLGFHGGWNVSGLANFTLNGNWLSSLVINTGYLYLLFFGFQEIQSLERDVVQSSAIPIISWIKRDFRLAKASYLGVAMIGSVVIASAVNILYAVAVYALHPGSVQLLQSQIPALYLADTFLGLNQELLIAIAFLIATVTTFVPAFLAATRHLAALGEDGYMPRSLASLSWLFTIVAIFMLAVGDQNFLVEITDFMVLISLGIIALSAIWMRRPGEVHSSLRLYLPLAVGASCFVAGAAIYFISASVVVFGFLAILFAYLVFDVIELGAIGVQAFLAVFDLMCLGALAFFPHSIYPGGTFLALLRIPPVTGDALLAYLVVISSIMLAANLLVDVKVLKLTSRR